MVNLCGFGCVHCWLQRLADRPRECFLLEDKLSSSREFSILKHYFLFKKIRLALYSLFRGKGA